MPQPLAGQAAEFVADRVDVIVAFASRRSVLVGRLEPLTGALEPDGGLWLAWPKRSSGVATDLTEADWIDGFSLKFFGAVCLIRAAWPHLKYAGGSVINVASFVALMGAAAPQIASRVAASMPGAGASSITFWWRRCSEQSRSNR